MPNYNFHKDKELGDEGEKYVLQLLKESGYEDAYMVIGKEIKWDIVIPSINKTVEVKNDIESNRTKNLAIELSKVTGEHSGIMASQSDVWVIFGGGELFMLDRLKLKEYCIEAEKSNIHRIAVGGDRNATRMMLIPIVEIKKQSFIRKIG